MYNKVYVNMSSFSQSHASSLLKTKYFIASSCGAATPSTCHPVQRIQEMQSISPVFSLSILGCCRNTVVQHGRGPEAHSEVTSEMLTGLCIYIAPTLVT